MGITSVIYNRSLKNMTLSLCLLMTAAAATAQTKAVSVRTPMHNMASVKHLGNPEGSILFQVKYENLTGDKFSVIIKDTDGAVLYQETYKDKNFDKKFQLPAGEADKIRFIIKAAGNKEAQTFEVNTSTRLVEEIVVNKVG